MPDVFYCNIDKMMKYAATGNLYDLTEYVENNEIFSPDNVWSCLNDLYRYDGETQGQGSIYALPKDVSAFPIFYNVDLFEAAGVTPPTAEDPWDWNDFLEAAKKLTTGEGDNKIYGTGRLLSGIGGLVQRRGVARPDPDRSQDYRPRFHRGFAVVRRPEPGPRCCPHPCGKQCPERL